MYASDPHKDHKKGFNPMETGGWEPPCGFWEVKPGPVQDQMLLTAEAFSGPVFSVFEAGSHYITQAGFRLKILHLHVTW